MRTVMIRVLPADLSTQMAEMRKWLDEHRYEASKFASYRYRKFISVSVDFNNEAEAENFAARFAGQQPQSAPDASLIIRRPFHANDKDPAVVTGTIAQACWWRLMAEEVRTEADGFASNTARETMQIAAQTYDRMAEDLERRLANVSGSLSLS